MNLSQARHHRGKKQRRRRRPKLHRRPGLQRHRWCWHTSSHIMVQFDIFGGCCRVSFSHRKLPAILASWNGRRLCKASWQKGYSMLRKTEGNGKHLGNSPFVLFMCRCSDRIYPLTSSKPSQVRIYYSGPLIDHPPQYTGQFWASEPLHYMNKMWIRLKVYCSISPQCGSPVTEALEVQGRKATPSRLKES